MTITLNRTKLYLIGIFIIAIYLLLNRATFIYKGNVTSGEVTNIKLWSTYSVGLHSGGNYNAPIIQFATDSFTITFTGITYSDLNIGDKVKVIYNKDEPTKAYVYSFEGFWFTPLLYCLLPLLFLTAAAFSFLTKSERVNITLGKKIKFFKTIISTPSKTRNEQEQSGK